jgi:hypothetical protein
MRNRRPMAVVIVATIKLYRGSSAMAYRRALPPVASDPGLFYLSPDMQGEDRASNADGGKDGTPGEWTMSQEREMLEKIVYHRFNFFMVLITIIATTILRSESILTLKLALGTGFGLSVLFLLSLWKNQRRLNAVLDHLVKMPGHPVAILDKTLGPDSSKGLIGYLIPLICIVILLLGNIIAWLFPRSLSP